jgi:bifunctional oligoribonuclease and PAP phosphatase NrnA
MILTSMPMMNELQFEQATTALDAAQSILVVTHVAPDGDAIGSLLGLVNALRERYPHKMIDAAVDGGVPEFLRFLPNMEIVKAELTSGQWDVMVSVDASDEPRTGKVGEHGRANSRQVINLDHHATNNYFGQVYLVNPKAVSATEVVFDWLATINHPLSRNVAIPLLTGLMTDTLGFRTSNVTSRTLAIAQILVGAGASLTEVSQRALESMAVSTLNLWKTVFPSITLEEGVIWASVTQADLARAGADETTEVGLSSFLVKVNEAMISASFKETSDGRVELSFRSKPGFDVAAVALSLDGGGHKQASGATVEGTLNDVMSRVIPMLKAAVKSGQLEIS